MKLKNNEVGVYAIGGLGEIGRNMYCVEYQDEIIIMDCGIKFPEDDMMGINYVISDYSYLVKNRKKIKALVVTHGHEDHIGGIPYLLKKIPEIPVYATPFALALIRGKLDEHGILNSSELHEEHEDTVLKFDKLSVSFFRTTHSIPDTLGIAVHTPEGAVLWVKQVNEALIDHENRIDSHEDRIAALERKLGVQDEQDDIYKELEELRAFKARTLREKALENNSTDIPYFKI